jgi:hypothetical protein
MSGKSRPGHETKRPFDPNGRCGGFLTHRVAALARRQPHQEYLPMASMDVRHLFSLSGKSPLAWRAAEFSSREADRPTSTGVLRCTAPSGSCGR